ncbi:putative sulfate exporter family transporter [Nocardioides albidus]|uniref:Putative sulfate exporter family transporter n=1 Tax=Nocardioides albidus TaxID=1517589 RepID=A0A5C4WT74_9ACTN|nr:putative sulfate exporter family transporter [Nocardioides albidus]TNM50805.1 putative sulfate exporter family transporter [Nocardioides albidus]
MATRTVPLRTTSAHRAPRSVLLPGLVITGAGVALAMAGHYVVPSVGVLTWAVLLGAMVANLDLIPIAAQPGLRIAVKKLLRVGVVLLGFSLSLTAIGALGAPVIALVVVTLVSTLVFTWWLGLKMQVGPARSLLIATGFSICGASAIAGMERTADADEDDVATAITMVTLCGTLAMIAIPLLQAPLGLSDRQLGIWAGASVHEVGQVVAAAGPAGATAVALAVVVKLTRVLLLAPVVAVVSATRRRTHPAGDGPGAGRPPLVPLFVLGFLACVLLRTSGIVPAGVLDVIGTLQTITLAAALFALGTGVHLGKLLHSGGRPLALGMVSTLVVATVSLLGVLAIA